MFVGGVCLGVWGVVLVVCACVGVGGVVLCRCVRVCDLLIFLPPNRVRLSTMWRASFSCLAALGERIYSPPVSNFSPVVLLGLARVNP